MATSSFNDSSIQITRPNCTEKCGDVSIPYPFGVGDGCYYVDPSRGRSSHNLTCDDNTTGTPRLIYGSNLVVVNITLQGEIRILNNIAYDCYDSDNRPIYSSNVIWCRKFTISTTKNSLVAIGCDTSVLFNGANIKYKTPLLSGCTTFCNKEQVDISDGITCSGIDCCKANLPSGLNLINTTAKSFNKHESVKDFNPCSIAFLVANDALPSYRDLLPRYASYLANVSYPVVYNWSVGTKSCAAARADNESVCKLNSECIDMQDQEGYQCQCKKGFQGNPYLDDCQGNFNLP